MLSAIAGLGLVTIATVNRAVFAGLERHLSLTPAARARRGIHRARLAVAEAAAAAAALATATATAIGATARLLARSPALRATARRVGQTTAGIKFLLTRGKSKFLIAVATIQNLIGQGVSRFLTCCTRSKNMFFLYCAPLPESILSLKHLSSIFLATSARYSMEGVYHKNLEMSNSSITG